MRGTISLTLLGLAGCLGFGQDHSSQDILEDGPIARVEVDLDAGMVSIASEADDQGATGTIEGRWTDTAPEIVHYVEDGVFHVIGRCPDVAVACRVDVTLEIPASANLGVHTGRGDVMVQGSRGDVEVTTDGGDIELRDADGTVIAETAGGNITGEGIVSPLVDARAGYGDIAIELTAPPFRADLRTDRGDISLVVPAGTYRIDAKASNGEVNVAADLKADELADHVIVAQTRSGDVNVESGRAAPQEQQGAEQQGPEQQGPARQAPQPRKGRGPHRPAPRPGPR